MREIMTKSLEEIGPGASVQQAARILKEKDIGAIPVCEGDKVIGMLTDRDIAIRTAAAGLDPRRTEVRQAMTHEAIFCFDDDDVQKAVKLMEDKQIRRLLVLDHSKKAVGIVSLGDIATRIHDEHICGEVLEKVSEPVHA